MWIGIIDLLGSAATATLFRRSLKRAAGRTPELARVTISRDLFEYRYALPAAWQAGDVETLNQLREIARELRPLLLELTGPVVLQRLRAVPDLERCQVFPVEEMP